MSTLTMMTAKCRYFPRMVLLLRIGRVYPIHFRCVEVLKPYEKNASSSLT